MKQNFEDFFVKMPKGVGEDKDKYAIAVVNLVEMFKKDEYTIPAYQRPYSWTKSEVQDLLTDLMKTMKSEKKWFCGPIFTTTSDFLDNSHFLLDGQQRMTTVFLMLRCLFSLDCLVDQDTFDKGLTFKANEDGKSTDERMKDSHDEFQKLKKHILKLLVTKKTNENSFEETISSKFQTELSIREKFDSFISVTEQINRENFKNLQFISASQKDKYAPTLKRINANLSFIYSELEKTLLQPNGLEILCGLGKHLTYNLMFIRIPLNKKGDVLDIFETLNSRGKPLALTDLIRFKTLKAGDQEKIKKIEKTWAEIFYYSGLLSEKGYFTSTDAFLERFINSISENSDGEKTDKNRILVFEEKYSSNYLDGVDEIYKVLKSWYSIIDFETGIIKNFPNKKKYMSLVHLLSMTLKISTASQFAFISYLRNMFNLEKYESDNSFKGEFSFVIFEIIKAVFSIVTFHGTPANTTRRIFIEIAKSFTPLSKKRLFYQNFNDSSLKDKLSFKSNFFPSDNFNISDDSKGIRNIIHSKSSEGKTAEFVLSMYHFLMGGTFPSKQEYEKSNLDHIMPQRWFNNSCWIKQNEKGEQDLNDSINKVKNKKIKNVLEEMLERESFWSDSSYADSFIQLIGNKFEILGKHNIEKSNNYWKDCDDNNKNGGAKKHLRLTFEEDPESFFMIPSKPKFVYDYDDFTIETIVERSEEIIETITNKLHEFKSSL